MTEQREIAELEAEIRRLREEPNIWIDVLKADLAAHRVVVRELDATLEVARNSLCASADYQRAPSNRYGLEQINKARAHPLVVAARMEGRG